MANIFKKLAEIIDFRKNSSFKNLAKKKSVETNYLHFQKVIKYIDSITDEKAKAKLTKEMKAYFAKVFNVEETRVLLANTELQKVADSVEMCVLLGDVTLDENMPKNEKMAFVRTIVGNVNITAKTVTLPNVKTLYGDVVLAEDSNFIAENLQEVKGSVLMENNKGTSILNAVKIGGTLNANYSQLTYAQNLKQVKGETLLRGSNIQYLQGLIKPGSRLDIRETNIIKLPKDIELGDEVYVQTTPHKFD